MILLIVPHFYLCLQSKYIAGRQCFVCCTDSGRENDIELQEWGNRYVKNGAGFYQVDERAKKRAVCFACVEFFDGWLIVVP